VTSGTFGLGWNLTSLAVPLSLTANQEYIAVVAVNASGLFTGGYSATSGFWNTGPGAGGITNGPLSAYSSTSPGTAPDNSNNSQMTFLVGGTDPTANLPHSSNSANYWLDILVGLPVVPPPPVVYSMRMFP
jgi:hypothetical protein